VVRRGGDRDRRVDPRQLLDRDGVGDGVRSAAAVLLGDRHAHQAELGELRDQVVGKTRLAVELLGHWCDALLREVAHGLPDELVLRVELEVHAAGDAIRRPLYGFSNGVHRPQADLSPCRYP
jgi:hypothetical protein